MGKAFIKLKKLSEKKGNSRIQKYLQAFSSHPDFDARIQQMRQRAEKDGYVVE
jgi:putative metalloprotease